MYSFSYLEPVYGSMSTSNCCFLTCIQVSEEAPEQLERPAGFPSSDKTRPDSPVPTLQGASLLLQVKILKLKNVMVELSKMEGPGFELNFLSPQSP